MTSNHFSGRCDEPDSLRDPIAESSLLKVIRLCIRLTYSELRQLVQDILHRHPELRQELAATKSEEAR